MRVKWMKNGVETSYINANKMGIDCPCCGHTNELNFETRVWTCDNCKHETKLTGIIYRAVSRYNQKVYIGQTELPLRTRINAHKSKKSDKPSVFVNIMRKYGPDNFDWYIEEIIEEDSSIDINDLEVKWIREYNSFVGWEGSWGYNSTIGGSKTIFSPESIAKRSGENHHNALLTPENAKTIKLLLRDTGLYLNEIAELFGVTFNAVFDIKRKRSWRQIEISDHDCLSNGYTQYLSVPKERRIPFFAFELGSCKFIGKFFDRKECANQLGVNSPDIIAVLYGRNKTTGNYTFILVEEYTKKWEKDVLPQLSNNKGKEFHVYHFRTGSYIGQFNNLYCCAYELELDYRSVHACLTGRNTYYGDYIFVYDDLHTETYISKLIAKAINNTRFAPRPFIVYNYVTAECVGLFAKQSKCAAELSLNSKCISLCLARKTTYHKDYIFIFEDDYTDEIRDQLIAKAKKNAQQKKVAFVVYDFTNGINVGHYESVVECAKNLDICKQGISDCLNDRRALVGRFVFIKTELFSENEVETKINTALSLAKYSKNK